eukprot:2106370-Pleurochrysis_carterae.AAC.2
MQSYLKDRFGERAANVLSVLKLWEAFGKVYNAACAPWDSDTEEYRGTRALAFVRAADLPIQKAVEFFTCAIESRGGQLKKFERKTVSWRPLSAASVVCNHIDSRTGLPVRRTQPYKSSQMEQMMERIIAIGKKRLMILAVSFQGQRPCDSSSSCASAS